MDLRASKCPALLIGDFNELSVTEGIYGSGAFGRGIVRRCWNWGSEAAPEATQAGRLSLRLPSTRVPLPCPAYLKRLSACSITGGNHFRAGARHRGAGVHISFLCMGKFGSRYGQILLPATFFCLSGSQP